MMVETSKKVAKLTLGTLWAGMTMAQTDEQMDGRADAAMTTISLPEFFSEG